MLDESMNWKRGIWGVGEKWNYTSLLFGSAPTTPIWAHLAIVGLHNIKDNAIPRPNIKMDKALAKRLWPDLIMHPHPVSAVKPCESITWLLRRMVNVIDGVPSWLSGLGIGGKLDRYVIQIFDSKSMRNSSGQSYVSFDPAVTENGPCGWLRFSSSIGSSGGVWGCVATISQCSDLLYLSSDVGCVAVDVYSFPRHHMDACGSSLFLGSGSQRYCTMRLHCPILILFIFILHLIPRVFASIWIPKWSRLCVMCGCTQVHMAVGMRNIYLVNGPGRRIQGR